MRRVRRSLRSWWHKLGPVLRRIDHERACAAPGGCIGPCRARWRQYVAPRARRRPGCSEADWPFVARPDRFGAGCRQVLGLFWTLERAGRAVKPTPAVELIDR